MIEPRAKNLLKATSINQLGMTERKTPPASERHCPDCGCRMSRYTPWTQSRCCPCDAKHKAAHAKPDPDGVVASGPVCIWCGRVILHRDARAKYCSDYCRMRVADIARRVKKQAS